MSELKSAIYRALHPPKVRTPDPLTLAEMIKTYIDENNIKQSEAARTFNISEARISQLLTIERELTESARQAVRNTDLSVGYVYEVARSEPYDQNAWAEAIEERYK